MRASRRHRAMEEYTYWFRENLAGSAVLTGAMKEILALERLAPPEDLLYDRQARDLLTKAVFVEKKKRAKSREVGLG